MTPAEPLVGRGGAYQLPHGSSEVTAITAKSKVRYAIDRWNRRIGAGLALGWATPAHASGVTFGSARSAVAAGSPPSPVRAITATRRWSRWASSRNQPP